MQQLKIECQEPKCKHEGVPCFYPDNETNIADEWYCPEHTFIHGFCYLCGGFYSGVENFDFPEYYGIVRGLCENCSDDLKTNLGECDEYDEKDEWTYSLDYDNYPV
jgi:hypothetical protein